MPELAESMPPAGLTRYIANVGDDASADRELPTCVDENTARTLYERMVLLRTYDERSLVYHRHGRIGTYAIYWGHEAMQVGSVSALADSDWVLPSYRESAVGLMRGMSPVTLLAWWRGQPEGWWNPQEYRVGSIAVPVASQVPHAAGVAWGEKLQGRNTAALVFFGDGATSEGDFHEGTNFAAVLNLPVVLLCNNNQWAITTPLSKQTRAERLSDKAVGYGIPAVRVDGNDVVAVFEAVHDAVERGRAGGGPTFIECVTYRPTLHATADDPTKYRDDEMAQQARDNDCLARFEQYLLRKGIIDEAHVEQTRAAADQLMRESIEAAEALPQPDPSIVFEPVFAHMPPSFARDLADLRETLGEGAGQ